jgi:SAM-dependent methyltransferase
MNFKKNLKNELRQVNYPYQSTIDFNKFIIKKNQFKPNTRILDAGCGIGNNTIYFAKKNKLVEFIGGDYSKKNILLAKKKFKKVNNLSFSFFDILKNKKKFVNKFDGIISIHTMCCFKDISEPIRKLCTLNPKWLCIKTLAYDADMDVLIHIRDYDSGMKDNNPDGDFNIFSKKKIISEFNKNKYKAEIHDYYPSKRIVIKDKKKRGSYTIKSDFHKNTVFSGPVYLPWKFIFAKKENV